jgi:hypothetical protein
MRAPKQKRARASDGGDPLVTVRLPAHLFASVKALAKEKGINRSAAVCALLELGLRAAPSDKGSSTANKLRDATRLNRLA